MVVFEFKAKGKTTQYAAINEAIKTAQFVRNKCIRFWMDNPGVGQKQLYRYNTALRAEYSFVFVNVDLCWIETGMLLLIFSN